MPAAGRLYRYGQASAPGLGRTGELCAQRTKAGAEKGVRTAICRDTSYRDSLKPIYFLPTTTLENGERVMSFELDEVVVVAKSRTVAERMGKVCHRSRDRAAAPVAGQLPEQ
ncbi:hypothetical protein [Alistipes putredinis]|uniref:hypothetical protein n=1 Tax=Alistipes putredinis TaxID=28117 RepID=UPI00399500B0